MKEYSQHNLTNIPSDWTLHRILEVGSFVKEFLDFEPGQIITIGPTRYLCTARSVEHYVEVVEVQTLDRCIAPIATKKHNKIRIDLLYAKTLPNNTKGVQLVFREDENKEWKAYRIHVIN